MAIHQSVYQVGGLKGDHCRDRIEHTLSHLAGVNHVGVDIKDRLVKVEYDTSRIGSGYIEETLQSLGYSIQG